MVEHTVHSYDEDLKALRRRVSEMGEMAEKMSAEVIQALKQHDLELAQEVIAKDPKLDHLQRAIEEHAIATIARRQPMAIDLRQLVAAMRIAGDLERIGDLAKSTAKRVLEVSPDAQFSRLILSLESMSGLVQKQLRDVLSSYLNNDPALAVNVWERDASVDALYTSVFRELLTYMMEDVRRITICTHLLFCAKNIERVGDHTTNIAESVHYLVTGQMLAIDRPKA